MNSKKIGVYLASILSVEKDPFVGIKKIHDLGFEYIQFPLCKSLFPEPNNDEKFNELFQCAEKYGLKVTGINADISDVDLRPLEQRMEPLKKIIDLAAKYNVPAVIVHGGEKILDDEAANQKAWQRLLENMRCLTEYAEKKRTMIAMEPGGPFWMIHGWKLLVRLKKEVGDLLKFNYDPANVAMGSENPVEGIYELKDSIVHFHLKDAEIISKNDAVEKYHQEIDNRVDELPFKRWLTAASSTDKYYRETPIGEGDVDFTALMKALKDVNYHGPFIIEREGSGKNKEHDIKQAEKHVLNCMD